MLLLICSQLLASEPGTEVMIASVSQGSEGSVELGSANLSSVEVSGSFGLTKTISLLASYGYGTIQTDYDTPYRESSSEEGYYDGSDYSFESGFSQHMISIGARYRHSLNDWASIYGKAEGNIAVHTIAFAPIISDEDPISKVSSLGLAFGGTASLGVMGTIDLKENLPAVFVYFEGGYNLLSAASFDSIGDLNLSGGYSSIGGGFRF